MNYWPGTKIIKSQGNAFDWRKRGSAVLNDPIIKASNSAKKKSTPKTPEPRQSFTIYSKAKRAA